jgi:hypothetical protein
VLLIFFFHDITAVENHKSNGLSVGLTMTECYLRFVLLANQQVIRFVVGYAVTNTAPTYMN